MHNYSMLSRMLFNFISKLFSGKAKFQIIAGTRFSESEFYEKSLLGRSLDRFSKRCVVKIFYENKLGLSEIYNRCISNNNKSEILIFIHDDVWILDDNFLEAVEDGLKKFDVLGVVGNTVRKPRAPSWAFREENSGDFVFEREGLSGMIAHGEPGKMGVNGYGPWPLPCEVLDGLFLAARRSVLLQNEVRFDERFSFDFYDLDFCRTARSNGLNLGTWPIKLIHKSKGGFRRPTWSSARDLYLAKWLD